MVFQKFLTIFMMGSRYEDPWYRTAWADMCFEAFRRDKLGGREGLDEKLINPVNLLEIVRNKGK
ncbi:MAG TPA: hypothetical protein DDY20_07570 [Desulfobulbaceae bacterium]|nr:hypothetical protein [Desulfobulbaceae bacterium]